MQAQINKISLKKIPAKYNQGDILTERITLHTHKFATRVIKILCRKPNQKQISRFQWSKK